MWSAQFRSLCEIADNREFAEPRLILEVSKDIPAGQELYFDYNDKSKNSLKLFPLLGK